MQEWSDAWYLLRCRENAWKTILETLTEAGLKTCCPLILERRRRKDKKNAYRLINYPAFPGYIFVKFNPSQIHTTAIKRMPGAMDFVHFGDRIATLHQEEVDALKRIHNPETQKLHLGAEYLPANFLNRIAQISTTNEPSVRIDMLFSMLKQPERLPME
jgi:transcriptional antiterminator RfaH